MEVARLLFARFVLTIALLVLGSTRVLADANEDARALFVHGVEASKQEHWQEAREHFRRSAALVPKPSTLLNLAVVEVRLGLAKDALATLEKFEKLANPSEHQEMLERAKALKQTVQSQLELKKDEKVLPELLGVDGLEGEAAALFQAGRQAYWSGRYEQALQYFKGAHELSKRPELLYDMAAAADRSRKNDKVALASLEQFLNERPDSPLASAVQARVEVLKQVVADDPDPAPTPTPSAPPPVVTVEKKRPERSAHERRAFRLLWTGVALEVAAAGTFVYWVNRARTRKECNNNKCESESTNELSDQKELGMKLALSTTAAATAVFASGLGYYIWAKRHPQVGVSADKHGAFVSFGAQF